MKRKVMVCETVDCAAPAALRCHWPGQTLAMCRECALPLEVELS